MSAIDIGSGRISPPVLSVEDRRQPFSSMRLVVLSPHRDDAAFSCGLLLAQIVRAGGSAHVVNVCTRSDYAPYLAPSAMPRPQQVSAARRMEDEAFLRLLPAEGTLSLLTASNPPVRMTDLGWLDAPLRLGIETEQVLSTKDATPAEVDRLAAELQICRDADVVLAPVGLGNHVDHRMVRDAACGAFAPAQVGFYDDLPYAAALSAAERASAAPPLLRHRPVEPHLFPAQLPGLKRRQVLCYPSQVGSELAEVMEADAARLQYGERLHLPGPLAERLAAALKPAS